MQNRVLVSILLGLLLAISGCTREENKEKQTLSLLTWGGYAPDAVVEQFEKENPDIDIKVTLSNNEEMIAKLKAGASFDLVQPSGDRILSAQQEYGFYQPIDLAQIKADFDPSILEATKQGATINGALYALPFVWGTDGLIVNKKLAASVQDYTDLCGPELVGKVSYRLKRPTLISFGYAIGEDPFAAYQDFERYQQILTKVEETLVACKKNVKTYWSGADVLLNLVRSGEVVAAMGWDTTGWKLHNTNPDIVYLVPRSGALGWIDTFAIPKNAKNTEAAYRWINFVMQPKIAAQLTNEMGNFVAAKDIQTHADIKSELKQNFALSFPGNTVKENIKWYPPVPAGFEAHEGKVLDRIQVASK